MDEGRVVRKGELLAEIESDELRAALREAQAQVVEAEAEARLAELTLQPPRGPRAREDRGRATTSTRPTPRPGDRAGPRATPRAPPSPGGEAQLRKTRIVAPIAGTVTGAPRAAGRDAGGRQRRVVTMADLGRLRIEAEADEADAARPGARARRCRSAADGFPGRTWPAASRRSAESVTLRRLKPQDPGRPTDTRVLGGEGRLRRAQPAQAGHDGAS